jgi:hypothetical protein
MRCEHPLPVLGSFDHSKHLSKIAAHSPDAFPKIVGKFHALQFCEPRGHMLLSHPGEASRPRLCGITPDSEVVRLVRILALNDAVQAGETQLVNLAPLRLNCILDCAMSKLFGKEVLCAGSDA